MLPTGAGKTRTALAAIAASSEPTLVLVPTRVLLHQWRAVLGEEFWEHDSFEHGHSLLGEVTRVPLGLAGAGVPQGVSRTPVGHVDLFQTLVAAGGARP